jgi:hypothetical protein
VCGVCGGQPVVGHIFSEYFMFPLSVIILSLATNIIGTFEAVVQGDSFSPQSYDWSATQKQPPGSSA